MKIIKLTVLLFLAINVPAISQSSGASDNNWVISGGGGTLSNGAQLTVGGGTSSSYGGSVNISTGGGSSGIGSITLLTPSQTGCTGLINLIVPNGSVRIGPGTSSYPLTISANGALTTAGAITAKSLAITNTVSAGSLTTTGTITTANLYATTGVGIGTAPRTDYILAVLGNVGINGSVAAQEVNVKTTIWPDYVFEKSYKLMTIPQLENFIKNNKHLPGVPDNQTVAQNGINVAQINAILLEKVEQQMLYIIELNKAVEELQKEIKNLKK